MTVIIDSHRFTTAGFDPETDIAWHSLFWAEGTDFTAEGYSDTDAVSPWPNETAEADATEATNKPSYDAVHASFNSQPVVAFDGTNDELTVAFTTPQTQPYSLVFIGSSVAGHSTPRLIDDGTTLIYEASNVIYLDAGGTARNIASYTADDNPHLFVFYVNGASSDAEVDGTDYSFSASPGTADIDGATIYNRPAGDRANGGDLALFGLYDGDIRADGSWSDFKTWVDDHYGITIS